MLNGVINSDNYSQVLRSIASRRRQGALEITFPERVVRIIFVQGRIIDVLDSRHDPATAILQILQMAGYFHEIETVSGGYRQLYEACELASPGLVHQEMFAEVVRQYVLDQLYGLEFGEGVYYTFTVQMIDVDREFLPSISVGQLLLDLVSLESYAIRVAELFPPDYKIQLQPVETNLSTGAQQIRAAIAGGVATLEQLRTHTFLSRYHFEEALLELVDCGSIVSFAPGGDAANQELSLAMAGKEEETELSEEDDLEDEPFEIDLMLRIKILDSLIVHSPAVPWAWAIIFLLYAILSPFVFWRDTFVAFSAL